MKVLVAPLDWGLGHATRCIPLINEFLRIGAEVELAVVRANAKLLQQAFPNLKQRVAPSYNIVYPKHGYNMGLWLLKNGVHLNSVVRREHAFAEEMVERHGYDVIVSDNRFGFYSKKAKSIYMTHQRRIAFPPALSAFESVGIWWHASVMRHFDEVWVPDLPGAASYAGRMSHVDFSPRPVKFVGALSRFSCKLHSSETSQENDLKNLPFVQILQETASVKYKFVAIVSGVEPARTRFEKTLLNAFGKIPGRHLIIQGRPANGIKRRSEGNVDVWTHLPDREFAAVVRNADYVISRGGYSTIMDMAVLGPRCIFVPTPGQYEQIVLARDLSQAGYAHAIDERSLDHEILQKMYEENSNRHLPPAESNNLLRLAVLQAQRKNV